VFEKGKKKLGSISEQCSNTSSKGREKEANTRKATPNFPDVNQGRREGEEGMVRGRVLTKKKIEKGASQKKMVGRGF